MTANEEVSVNATIKFRHQFHQKQFLHREERRTTVKVFIQCGRCLSFTHKRLEQSVLTHHAANVTLHSEAKLAASRLIGPF